MASNSDPLNMRFSRILLSVLILAMSACETTVEIDLPSHEPRVVVNSLFYPASPLVVDLSRSYRLDDNGSGPIPPAVVSVYEGGTLVETLKADTMSVRRYVATNLHPVPGHSYTLRATVPGFAPVEATDVVPEQPLAEVTVQPLGVDQTNTVPFEVSIQLTDPAGQVNYYALSIVAVEYVDGQPAPPSGFASSGTWTSRDPVLLDGEQADLLDEDVNYGFAVFSDRAIDGETYTIRLTVPLRPAQTEETDVDNYKYYMNVMGVSEVLYRYFKTTAQADGIDSFSEPVELSTNVHGGLGIFGAYNARLFFIAEL